MRGVRLVMKDVPWTGYLNGMRSRVRGWRWRRSPLRRRSDVVEAWTVLALAALLLLGAPLVGAAAAGWAHDDARATAREQRADRRHVRAEVVGRSSEVFPMAQGRRQQLAKVTVRWTEPGDSPRTATARAPAGARTGDAVDVWLDSRDRPVGPPPDSTAVWQHTVVVGVCAAGGAAAVVLLGHAVVRRAALCRRLAEWEQEWARTEPRWTGRHA